MRTNTQFSRILIGLVAVAAFLLLGTTASFAWTVTQSFTGADHTWIVTPGSGETINDFHVAFPLVLRSSTSYKVDVLNMPPNWQASLSGGGHKEMVAGKEVWKPGHLYLNFFADGAGAPLSGATTFTVKVKKGFNLNAEESMTCVVTTDGDEDQATGRLATSGGNENPRIVDGPVVYNKAPSMTPYGLLALILLICLTAIWIYRRKAVAMA